MDGTPDVIAATRRLCEGIASLRRNRFSCPPRSPRRSSWQSSASRLTSSGNRGRTPGLTTDAGHFPVSTAAAFRAPRTFESSVDSTELPAQCGVRITLSSSSSGWSRRRVRRQGEHVDPLEHVQRRPGDSLLPQRLDQGRLVDDRPAGRVDQAPRSASSAPAGRRRAGAASPASAAGGSTRSRSREQPVEFDQLDAEPVRVGPVPVRGRGPRPAAAVRSRGPARRPPWRWPRSRPARASGRRRGGRRGRGGPTSRPGPSPRSSTAAGGRTPGAAPACARPARSGRSRARWRRRSRDRVAASMSIRSVPAPSREITRQRVSRSITDPGHVRRRPPAGRRSRRPPPGSRPAFWPSISVHARAGRAPARPRSPGSTG